MLEGLPVDTVLNILTRIPVENTLRCTSVCKSWYNLINSPSFLSSHLKLFRTNNQNTLLIWFYYRDVHIINQKIEQLEKLDCPLKAPDSHRYFRIIDCLNGVVCLFDYHQYNGKDRERTMLWNPFIRKSVMLPTYRPDYTDCNFGIGFGFLPRTNDYKVVLVLNLPGDLPKDNVVKLAVYELSTGSWREIYDPDFRYKIQGIDSQVYLGGIVHWCGWSRSSIDESYSRSIVLFDMLDERFSDLMLPSCLQDVKEPIQVSIYKESLCVMQNAVGSCMVRVMKEYGVADSWIMLWKVELPQYRSAGSAYLRENGEILTNRRYSWPLVSYDPITKKYTAIEGWKKKNLEGVYNYTKSLFLIKSFNQTSKKIGRM